MMNDNLSFNPVTITGIGRYIPETVITNEDIAKLVDTNDEWITSRTGIKQRRVVSGNETSASMASKAAIDALAFAGVNPQEIDLIIVATSLPDSLYPSTACEVQAEIGAVNAAAFNLVAACSGLVYGLNVARNFIMTGTYKKVLLLGVDVHSRFLDWGDRSTCILFGDAAGSLLLEQSVDEQNDILSVDMHANGEKASELSIPLYGKNCPLVEPNEIKQQYVNMNGKEIYKFAVSVVPKSIKDALSGAGLNVDNIDYLIPHQANMRIVSSIMDKLKLSEEQVIANLHKYGNTSTASICVALLEEILNGKIKQDSIMAMCGFGSGLTWGTAIVRWRAVDKRKNNN